ncbi:glycosyltransferase [Enemella evansiae]|uniref:glycosyltransferase n=1 Tax=Enemella evansiae TaxID=2016499 RepID=UPI0015C68E39|nr:glycosyltransferase [Enemella evansiae]
MSDPIRLLCILHTAQPSGAELSAIRLLAALRRTDVDARALTLADGPVVELLTQRGIPVTVRPVNTRATRIGGGPRALARGVRQLIAAGWRIGGELAGEQTDARVQVLMAESTKALLLGALITARCRIPLVWRVHDRVSADYFGLPVSVAVRLFGALVADGFLANSRSTAQTLWTLGKPLAVCSPGVEAGSAHREQAEPDAVVLGMAGRITEWKGQDVLLDALAGMRNRPRVRFFGAALFGEDAYRDRLLAQVDRLGLADRVTFTGHVDDPLTALSGCDIAVHCSRQAEPFGQVIVEAMSVGAVPVATAPGGPSEIITGWRDGVLLDPEDPPQLGRTLDRLIEDRPLRTRLADAARRRAGDFSVDASARIARTLLQQVIGGRR